MTILQYPNPILRQKAALITEFDNKDLSLNKWSKISQEMFETMDEAGGIGLSGPQVGISEQIIIIGYSKVYVFLNPKIIPISDKGTNINYEGCLSIPGINGEVKRFNEINVEYQDIFGDKYFHKLSGIEARIAQHEYDHAVLGKLFFERMTKVNYKKIESFLKELEDLDKEVKLLNKIFNKKNEVSN